MPGDSPMTLPQLSRAPLIGLAYATGPPQRHLSSGRPAALHSELKGRFAASQAVWWPSGGGPMWRFSALFDGMPRLQARLRRYSQTLEMLWGGCGVAQGSLRVAYGRPQGGPGVPTGWLPESLRVASVGFRVAVNLLPEADTTRKTARYKRAGS